jgi:mitochondrial import inner membrane translocase subunit TIM10
MSKSCAKKCIPTTYQEGELNKGESVCLDRCAAKFFDVHMKVSDIMQKEMQHRQGGAPGGF